MAVREKITAALIIIIYICDIAPLSEHRGCHMSTCRHATLPFYTSLCTYFFCRNMIIVALCVKSLTPSYITHHLTLAPAGVSRAVDHSVMIIKVAEVEYHGV